MKTKSFNVLFLIMVLSLFLGCSGGGGSGTDGVGYGTISMDITDSRPFIDSDDEPDELWLDIDEISVHLSGSGWINPTLPQYPYEINLLAFHNGETTQLVPPALIPEGNITQIRMVISRAYMVFPDRIEEIDLDVPSGKLRTSKKCDYWMYDGDTLKITIHFDLSQSIVQTGENEYKMKPVFHPFNTTLEQAAKICGSIAGGSYYGDPEEDMLVTVLWQHGLDLEEVVEPFTKVWVEKDPDPEKDNTQFCIYWLVPLPTDDEFVESYLVQITYDGETYPIETIDETDLGPGDTYNISGGASIEILPPPPPPPT